jgi:hypothetical protein
MLILVMIFALDCDHCTELPASVHTWFFPSSFQLFNHQQRTSMDSLAHSRGRTLDSALVTIKVCAVSFSIVLSFITQLAAMMLYGPEGIHACMVS